MVCMRAMLQLHYNISVTMGNKYKVLNHSCQYDFIKFSFAARIVNIWTSLPNYIVNVHSVTPFKVKPRLDKFWAGQKILFDWTADITGTGARLEYTVESNWNFFY